MLIKDFVHNDSLNAENSWCITVFHISFLLYMCIFIYKERGWVE